MRIAFFTALAACVFAAPTPHPPPVAVPAPAPELKLRDVDTTGYTYPVLNDFTAWIPDMGYYMNSIVWVPVSVSDPTAWDESAAIPIGYPRRRDVPPASVDAVPWQARFYLEPTSLFDATQWTPLAMAPYAVVSSAALDEHRLWEPNTIYLAGCFIYDSTGAVFLATKNVATEPTESDHWTNNLNPTPTLYGPFRPSIVSFFQWSEYTRFIQGSFVWVQDTMWSPSARKRAEHVAELAERAGAPIWVPSTVGTVWYLFEAPLTITTGETFDPTPWTLDTSAGNPATGGSYTIQPLYTAAEAHLYTSGEIYLRGAYVCHSVGGALFMAADKTISTPDAAKTAEWRWVSDTGCEVTNIVPLTSGMDDMLGFVEDTLYAASAVVWVDVAVATPTTSVEPSPTPATGRRRRAVPTNAIPWAARTTFRSGPVFDPADWTPLATAPYAVYSGDGDEWGPQTIYPAGSVVTYGGVAWIALRDNVRTPEEGNYWTLYVASSSSSSSSSSFTSTPTSSASSSTSESTSSSSPSTSTSSAASQPTGGGGGGNGNGNGNGGQHGHHSHNQGGGQTTATNTNTNTNTQTGGTNTNTGTGTKPTPPATNTGTAPTSTPTGGGNGPNNGGNGHSGNGHSGNGHNNNNSGGGDRPHNHSNGNGKSGGAGPKPKPKPNPQPMPKPGQQCRPRPPLHD